MKKFLNLIIILIMCFVIASCNEISNSNEIIIKVEEDTLTWNDYNDALKYNIYIDGVLFDTTTETKYELKLKEGSYKIKVNAKLSNAFSSFSNIITYESDGSKYEDVIINVKSPTIKIFKGVISWNKVTNAVSYDIYKNFVYHILL